MPLPSVARHAVATHPFPSVVDARGHVVLLVAPATHRQVALAAFLFQRLPQRRPKVVPIAQGPVRSSRPLPLRMSLTRRGMSNARRLGDLHPLRPMHHTIHLVQKLGLAALLGRQVQAKANLLHGGAAGDGHALIARKSRARFAESGCLAVPCAVVVAQLCHALRNAGEVVQQALDGFAGFGLLRNLGLRQVELVGGQLPTRSISSWDHHFDVMPQNLIDEVCASGCSRDVCRVPRMTRRDLKLTVVPWTKPTFVAEQPAVSMLRATACSSFQPSANRPRPPDADGATRDG